MFGERGKHIFRPGTIIVDTGTTGTLDAVSDRAQVRVEDLFNVTLVANAVTPSTTVTIVFEVSYDSSGWVSGGTSATIANFTAANIAYALPQSDTHGMPLPIRDARATITVFTGSGSYTFGVAGYQRMGYA
jgi:hypothetical protein